MNPQNLQAIGSSYNNTAIYRMLRQDQERSEILEIDMF